MCSAKCVTENENIDNNNNNCSMTHSSGYHQWISNLSNYKEKTVKTDTHKTKTCQRRILWHDEGFQAEKLPM